MDTFGPNWAILIATQSNYNFNFFAQTELSILVRCFNVTEKCTIMRVESIFFFKFLNIISRTSCYWESRKRGKGNGDGPLTLTTQLVVNLYPLNAPLGYAYYARNMVYTIGKFLLLT